ncbi:hypothetical protein GS461_20480 [Rhodococcus hoagii]|nr:hypothetical protein [Prescottella equi]
MGSDSRLPTMEAAAGGSRRVRCPVFEVGVASAHRPRSACSTTRMTRPVAVSSLIAGAGGAAPLPGWWRRDAAGR